MSPRKSRAEWALLIAEFDRSGVTHREFCDAHGLTLGSFQHWLYELRRDPSPQFLPVHVVARPASVDATLVIETANARVHVRVGTDVGYVVDLVRGLS